MSVDVAPDLIETLSHEIKDRFAEQKILLSFEDYLAVVRAQPSAQIRDAVTYLRDLFDHFGSTPVNHPYGQWRRFHLFDDPTPEGLEQNQVVRGVDAVAGQEAIQTRIYELLNDFVREGRINRLILLHGPNGSAKSSIIRCIAKGLERYSEHEKGALYTFSWVFPNKRRDGSSGIGFGQGSHASPLASYAYLAGTEIESRVTNELRDHPLLLIPKQARQAWIRDLLGAEVAIPSYLLEGELSPKSAQIYEALLVSYQGDLREVLKHVQVERFVASRRYRRAIATVDPQLRTDAHARQITADRSLGALPQSLQHLNLYEGGGHLVEGNRGLIEYNDLLKRPIETFKYLLSTCESGVVRLDQITLYLDALLIGSCNFEHLEAFKDAPDFSSFKGRLELIEVPYLRDVRHECEIYRPQLKALSAELDIAPDVDLSLAYWGVMTRLERPQPTNFSKENKELIERLSAFEKADLYAYGRAPERLSHHDGTSLTQVIEDLYHEPQLAPLYEGLMGASPRELKALLLGLANQNHASQASAERKGASIERPCLTPLDLFDALRQLCEQSALHPFLKRKPSGGYYQPKIFIQELENWVFKRLEERLFRVFGLVQDESISEIFNLYIAHINCVVKGETYHNPLTDRFEQPDESLMADIEVRIGRKHDLKERAELIQRVASWRIKHTQGPLLISDIFSSELKALRASYVKERRDKVAHDLDILCRFLAEDETLTQEEHAQAHQHLHGLEKSGYPRSCARPMLHALNARNDI